MAVVTPATVRPPLATSVAEVRVVPASTALVARSVHDTSVPGVAAVKAGSAGSSLPPQAVSEVAAPDTRAATTKALGCLLRMQDLHVLSAGHRIWFLLETKCNFQ
ncbi:MAG: hypothetical protein U5N53_05855 [Mycobacterium sp.]|nr:hypothetical protein [Mycobacterium sp.]